MAGSTVAIERISVAGAVTDITERCVFNRCTFESQMSGQPGLFQVTVLDRDQTMLFTAGERIRLTIDGIVLYGGYITQVSRTFAAPVLDTSAVGSVSGRMWVLRGADYNLLFEKLVLRNPDNYTTQLPGFSGDTTDGELIRTMCSQYLDVPPDFSTANVRDINCVFFQQSEIIGPDGIIAPDCDPSQIGAWSQQGTIFRSQVQEFAEINSAIYYIDPEMVMSYLPIEDAEMPWGFSDVPNKRAISSSSGFSGSTVGFREIDVVEDGSVIVNDALIWGGKALTSETIVFARVENAETIATYGRWQRAENHVGQDYYGTQTNVDLRAQRLVDGVTGSVGGLERGLKQPQWTVRLTWFAHDVPTLSGSPFHLRAGYFAQILLYTFGTTSVVSGRTVRHPLVLRLPIRAIRMSFPNLDPAGNGYVKFEGTFGIQASDSWNLWAYLSRQGDQSAEAISVTTANDGSTSVEYGSYGTFSVQEPQDGSRTDFSIKFGYISQTLEVSVNGILQQPGTSVMELDPAAGTFRLSRAPTATDWISVRCRTLAG